MKKKEQTEKLIKYLNYKDILIILGTWYFTALIILIARQLTLEHLILTNIFHFLFIVSGRFIYFSLIIFYLNSLYPIEFKDLGLKLSNLKRQFKTSFPKIVLLFIMSLLLINIPLSYAPDINFSALFKITGPDTLLYSLIPYTLLLISCLFISLSEQFILNVVIFELFNYTLFNYFFSLILSALFYSIIISSLTPSRILVNFIAAIISILLYSREDSIIPSSLFMAAYYSIYITYIYGWEFIKF